MHRDLKPTNLMLTRDGRLKVADFGVARSMADSITRVSMMSAGTLVYMSPQQAMGEEPAPADDIYALGATLYELLTGKPPFHTGDVRVQMFQRKPDSIAVRRKVHGVAAGPVPPEWERALAACLAKEAADRPPSAGEAVRRFTESAPVPRRRWRRPTRREWVLGGVALAVAALTALTFVRRAARDPMANGGEFPSDATRALAAWNFDGDVRDASGRGFDSISDRATPTLDRFGRIDRALYFNGRTGILVPDAAALRFGGAQPFTAALWVRSDDVNANFGDVWASRGNEVSSFGWGVGFDHSRPTGGVFQQQQEGGLILKANTQLAPGEWHHLAVVSDGTVVRLFVDGGLEASAPLGHLRTAKAPTTAQMRFGLPAQFVAQGLTGALDDARLWRRALAPQEIAALVSRESPPHVVITAGQYHDTDDLAAAILTEFGPRATLLDWSDLKRRWGDEIRGWADETGFVPGAISGWVQRDGQRLFDEKRCYFVHRFDGVKPDYYMVHDECGGLTLDLGSWYLSQNPILVSLPALPIQQETLRPGSDPRLIQREGPLGQNRTAAALTWRAQVTPSNQHVTTARLRLADGREIQAVCELKVDALAVALGPVGERGVSRSLAPSFGEYEFTLAATRRRWSFRAVSTVGGNLLFRDDLALPGVEVGNVVGITLSNGGQSALAKATLVIE